MVIFSTKFRCTLIAMYFQTKNFVSILYAKYGDYGIYRLGMRSMHVFPMHAKH